ncbi:MAG: iron-sulfur cluster co-chaperone HscB C-terminal domain-containing protein [Planctomycetota bacterium]
MTRDPFATFELSPSMHLDLRELEARYFARSRQVHPDHRPDSSDLSAAADLNDDYKTLRDPWRRARALCELQESGVLVRQERLPPQHLEAALDLAEAVAAAEPGDVHGLSEQIRTKLSDILREVTAHLDRGEARAAATLLNLARYWQKAAADLARVDS